MRTSGIFAFFLLSLANNDVAAFTPSRLQLASLPQTRPSVRLAASTMDAPTDQTTPTTWECDEDLNQCVEVPACDDEGCRTSLDVRIHGEWYDITGWRKAHPAGDHWIDWYDGRDATEVMDAFHSEKGRAMYKRLPKSKPEAAEALEETTAPDTSTQVAFRELREELEAGGWWERDMVHEGVQLGLWGACVLVAAATAQSVPLLSTFALGLSMTAAGWLGHDYIHGVDKFTDKMRNFAAVAAGLAPTWWSDKHNKHHALSKCSPIN